MPVSSCPARSTCGTAVFHLPAFPSPGPHQISLSTLFCFPPKNRFLAGVTASFTIAASVPSLFFKSRGSCRSDYILVHLLRGEQHSNSLFSDFNLVVWQPRCICLFSSFFLLFLRRVSFPALSKCLLCNPLVCDRLQGKDNKMPK